MANGMKVFTILLVFMVWGCMSDLEIEHPNVPNIPVVNGLLSPDSTLSVNISGLLEVNQSYSESVSNASVLITDSTENVLSLLPVGQGTYRLDYLPQKGMTYSLQVDIPNQKSMFSTTTIPSTYAPDSVSLSNSWHHYSPPQYIYQIKAYPLFISLPALENDTYLVFRFVAKRKGTYWTNDSIGTYEPIEPAISHFIPLYSNDSDFTYVGQDEHYIFQSEYSIINELTDYMFWVSEELYYPIGLGASGELVYDTELYLDVISCSPEFYKYFRTYIINASERINPFVEPVEVYSNIENGLGIFAGYTINRVQVLIR